MTKSIIKLIKDRHIKTEDSLDQIITRIELDRNGLTVPENFGDPRHTHYRAKKEKRAKRQLRRR